MTKSIAYSTKDENEAWELYKKELQKIKESTLLAKKNGENKKEICKTR